MLMTYRQLFRIMKRAKLSPEQFGSLIGISGMTIRRWRKTPSDAVLPEIYAGAVVRALRRLVVERRLSSTEPDVQQALKADWLPFDVAASGMGLSSEVLGKLAGDPRGAIDTLSEIGSSEEKRGVVDASMSVVRSFGKKGKDWAYRIRKLLSVINSRDLHAVDKLVAYGALFYLLNPFDFIPDHIPVFGLLDDFFFLSAALTFYLQRYPHLFKDDR